MQSASEHSTPVLIFLRLCAQLLKETGHLPQPTSLPDIETSTQSYLELKQVYKSQHQLDLSRLEAIMRQLYNKQPADTLPLSRETLSEYINDIEAIQVMELGPYWK